MTVPPLVLGCPPDTPLEAAARPGDPAQPSTRGGLGLRIAVATGSGALLVLSFPPYGAWPLAPVSVAALTLACRGQRLPGAFLTGLAAGLALFLPLLHWTSNVGVDAWVALATVEALAIGGLGVVLTVVDRLPGWPVWSAAGWVLEEAVRGRAPFGGFPWGRLAFGQGATPFTEYAAWGGAPLVTFAVALCGSLLAWAALDCLPRPAPGTRQVLRRVLRRVGGVVAVLAVPVVGLVAPVALPVSGTATVAVVQGNVPRLGLEFNAQRAAVLGNHVAATERLGDAIQAGREPQPDLVVWPENSSDIDPLVDPDAAAQIDRAARSVGAPLLVGAVLAGPGRYIRNAGIVWDPVAGPGETYVKRHPVPFAEYVPFRPVLTALIGRFAMVPNDFLAGPTAGTLTVGPVRLGDVICFEVAYDSLVRDTVVGGGRLLVVQTNNATFGRSGETEQQLAMSRLRAVEHGRAVLVAATSGVSAIIGPNGRLQDRAEVFTAKTAVRRLPLADRRTPADRVGAAPEWLLTAVAVGALGAGMFGHRRGSA